MTMPHGVDVVNREPARGDQRASVLREMFA